MKYEVLERDSQDFLKNLKNEIRAEKEKAENFDKKLKEMIQSEKGYIHAVGLGTFTFIMELLMTLKSKEAVAQYCTLKKFDEEATEFLKLQKERYEIVKQAEKMGLKVDLKPEEDIENFLESANQFTTSNIEKVFKGAKDEITKRYDEISKITSSYLKEKKETLFEKTGLKKESSYERN